MAPTTELRIYRHDMSVDRTVKCTMSAKLVHMRDVMLLWNILCSPRAMQTMVMFLNMVNMATVKYCRLLLLV